MAKNIPNMNEMIVNKVSQILDNAKHIQSVHIYIDGAPGEAPVIRYDITEVISYDRDQSTSVC